MKEWEIFGYVNLWFKKSNRKLTRDVTMWLKCTIFLFIQFSSLGCDFNQIGNGTNNEWKKERQSFPNIENIFSSVQSWFIVLYFLDLFSPSDDKTRRQMLKMFSQEQLRYSSGCKGFCLKWTLVLSPNSLVISLRTSIICTTSCFVYITQKYQ